MACNHAPGSGTDCYHDAVASNLHMPVYMPPAAERYGPARANGTDATADMRDGDADSGSIAPVPPATPRLKG